MEYSALANRDVLLKRGRAEGVRSQVGWRCDAGARSSTDNQTHTRTNKLKHGYESNYVSVTFFAGPHTNTHTNTHTHAHTHTHTERERERETTLWHERFCLL